MKGTLERVDGLLTGEYLLTIRTATNPGLRELVGKGVAFEVKKDRGRRSLDANGYYWVLVTKLAEGLRTSKSRIHNILLRRYGQRMLIDDKPIYAVIPDTDEASRLTEEDETIHLKPTSEVKSGRDGRLYRTYILLRGSHEYDTREMSVLIDGTISECKEVGIETLTPEELERLKGYEKQAVKNV